MTIEEKFSRLKDKLKQMDSVIIAFSGGVDSTFLLKAASLSELNATLAVTGVSESLPQEEYSFAREIADSLNIKHKSITTEELKDINYSNNTPDRCYYCKKELFGRLKDIAKKENYHCILDGTNADDAQDWRPGRRAAKEEGVMSPLLEVGLGKKEIRVLSRNLGLRTWDKPSTPCLSSRFPYGQKITPDALERVNKAEAFIKRFGVNELRVRNHSEEAKIEILPDEFHKLMKDPVRKEIVDFLKSLGFKHITLDLQGFRSGSLNEILEKDSRGRGA
jgi:uncharacterized protein